MYYRIAIQLRVSTHWYWRSTALSSLDAVFRFLRLYQAYPQDRLRVFSSSSRENMDEQLMRENNGLGSTSVTAAQFLRERMIGSREVTGEASKHEPPEHQGAASSSAPARPSSNESSAVASTLEGKGMSSLDRRRIELERGTGGDHDVPYIFALPHSLPHILAWMKLLAKVQRGELPP